MSDKPKILLVGEVERSEFARVCDWLDQIGTAAIVQRSECLPDPNGDDVGTLGNPPVIPDLVIVCQSWPDEFPATEVTTALGRWPLALWVCCYGAWCASDGRTRLIWPISVRVPVDEAENRLNHVWRVLTEQRDEPLPLTASRDEAFEFDHCLTTAVVRP